MPMSVFLRVKVAAHVVDVAAAAVVVDHRAHRQRVGDQRQVQHRGHVGIRIAVGGHSVAGGDVGLRDIELRLVGDVADDPCLGSCTEQCALRALQNLDSIQVRGIDIKIAIRQLAGLIVQVDRDVRPQAGRCAALAGLGTRAQAAHEDLVLPGSIVGRRDIRQILDVVVQGLHVQLAQRFAGHRPNRDRHVLYVLRSPLRRDRDFLNRFGVGFGIAGRSGVADSGG